MALPLRLLLLLLLRRPRLGPRVPPVLSLDLLRTPAHSHLPLLPTSLGLLLLVVVGDDFEGAGGGHAQLTEADAVPLGLRKEAIHGGHESTASMITRK